MTAEKPLPRVQVQYPKRDARGRWTLGDLHVSEAEDSKPESLYAALDHIIQWPSDTRRGIKRVHKR